MQRLSKTSETKLRGYKMNSLYLPLLYLLETYQASRRVGTLPNEDNNQILDPSPQNLIANPKKSIKKFNSLHQILDKISERKKTFGTFAFQTPELDDEKNLNLLLKDFAWQNQKGTMYVSELWPASNLDNYIRQNQ
jgi:hypothetical protein